MPHQTKLCIILAACAIAPAQERKTPVTPEKLLSLAAVPTPRPSGYHWLDANRVLFSMSEHDEATGKSTTYIEVMELASAKRTRLTTGSDPHPSPDGSTVAFFSTTGSNKTLSLYSFRDASVKNIFSFQGETNPTTYGFSWSPDSSKIVCGFRPEIPKSAATDTKDKSSVVIVGESEIAAESEVWLLDIARGQKRLLTSGRYRFMSPGWTPDGKTVIFAAPFFGADYHSGQWDGKVVGVSVASGEVRTLVRDAGVQSLNPAISPDGKQIAFSYDPNNVYYPHYSYIALAPAEGGAIQSLTDEIFVSSGPQWAPDGKRIYFACKEGVYNKLCAVTTAGVWKRIIEEPRNVSNVAVSPDGGRLLFTTDDAYGSIQVRETDSNGQHERVVADLTPPAFHELALGDASEVTWKSTDGLVIHGLLIKPVGYQPGKRYPLLVDLHGGPIGGVVLLGSILLKTPFELHMWAAKGFAVFAADYRESEKYGWKTILKLKENQDYLDRDMDDVMTGVDDLIHQGIADPEKLALIGHSYGSIMTNWLITHTHRFKVAISYEGIVDNFFSYGVGMRVGGNPAWEWYYKGKPWETPQNYRKNASSEFVKGVTTPTLFIANDYGGKSGVENLYHHEFMYTALLQQGVDTKMLIYRGEGHVIQKPENLRDLLTRSIDWIDSHLKMPVHSSRQTPSK